MNLLLAPLSLIYGSITSIRNFLFDVGILNSKKFDIPIICVGNLSVGGNGKTPHVDYLAKTLKGKYKVAIISRGYKRKNYNFSYVEINSSVKDVGDEPLMLKKRNPNITVVVCGDRIKAVNKLKKDKPSTELILLDDGFQHRWINSSLNLLLTNINKPFYKDYLLPLGNLRENRSECRRADCIIITNYQKAYDTHKKEIISNILKYYNKQIIFSSIKYQKPIGVFNNEILDDLNERKIILITGIANSIELKTHLNKKSEIIKHFKFDDHYNYYKEDIMNILSFYKTLEDNKKLILTTEKDKDKLIQYEDLFKGCELYYLPIEVELNNKEEFDKIILDYARKN